MTDFNQTDMQRNTTPDADRRELLRLLSEKQRRKSGIPSAPLPRPRVGPLPLSEVQERLWAQQGLGEGAAWTVAGALELVGVLDVEALRSALDALVARHEPLRTRFVSSPDGMPRQVIDNPAGAAFQVRAAKRSQVKDLVRAHEGKAFHLEQGPLFRVLLIELGAKEYVLSLAMHHIIADGWSMDVLVRDMQELYGAALEDRTPSLVPLDIQYADWAAWQRERDLSGSLEYWKRSLAGPPVPLALGRVIASRARGEAQQVERPIPRYVADALVSYARDRRASLFMVLLAGWALVMYRRTRASDLLLGTTVAGRERLELEPLIGFFINIVALRLDLSGDPTGDELMDHVRGTVLDGFLHQGVPFERLLAEVEGLRQPGGRSPVPVVVRH
ncbi:MAG TPA: condensation domain-containing protein, partial [Acidobacteriaceae bacterium]